MHWALRSQASLQCEAMRQPVELPQLPLTMLRSANSQILRRLQSKLDLLCKASGRLSSGFQDVGVDLFQMMFNCRVIIINAERCELKNRAHDKIGLSRRTSSIKIT